MLGPFDDEDAPANDEMAMADAGATSRRAAVRRRLQWFATSFEDFLRRQPALWYLWGDKRWTRVLRGDPRYVGLPSGDEARSAQAEQHVEKDG